MGKQNVSSLVVRETEDGLKADVECVRRPPNSIAFLRLLSHLFKVRPIRFPPWYFSSDIQVQSGYSARSRILKAFGLRGLCRLSRMFRRCRNRSEKVRPLQRSLVRWRLLSRWEKQEVNPSSSTTIFGNFPIGHLASFSLKAGFI